MSFTAIAPSPTPEVTPLADRWRTSPATKIPGTLVSKAEVSTGTGLTVSMQNSGVFPSMVLQMVAIGEESGALDAMLGKVADF